MKDALDRYVRISEGFDTRLRAVATNQWSAQTPCPDWDVRALVSHLVGTHHLILSTLGQTHDSPGPDTDLVVAWSEARGAVTAALGDPATADRIVQGFSGESKFSDLAGGLLCGDTLFHTWDLARATNQDDTLDAIECERQLKMMQPMESFIRQPGMFGPAVDTPGGADAQTQLLTFGGRQP